MSKQKIETMINESHPVWKSCPYAQEPTPVGILKYNGKNLGPMSPPNRLIHYHESQKLGSGGFGTVYEGASYKISYPLKELTYKKDKVVKVIKNVDAQKRRVILAEYEQGKKAPQLGMKEPIFSGDIDNQTCYIVMNRLPGKELFELFADGTIGKLPVNKKIELTHKLLLALRDQVTREGIVHRDLKAENIMVQLEPEIEVNIIDYGLAKEQNTNDGMFPGSSAYVAPEVCKGQYHDSACDVFSMAKVIALLWVDDLSLFVPIDKYEMLDFSIRSAELLKSCQSEELKQNPEIFNMLCGMLVQNQLNRLTINQALESFEKAYPKIVEKKESHGEVNIHNSSERLKEPLKIKISNSTKNIIKYLNNLDDYAAKIQESHPEDSETIKNFTDDMRQVINGEGKDIEKIKRECSIKLKEPKIVKCAEEHKYAQYILKNIVAAVVGLGLFYGIACGINKLATGRVTFFHNDIRKAQFNIEKEINSIAVVA